MLAVIGSMMGCTATVGTGPIERERPAPAPTPVPSPAPPLSPVEVDAGSSPLPPSMPTCDPNMPSTCPAPSACVWWSEAVDGADGLYVCLAPSPSPEAGTPDSAPDAGPACGVYPAPSAADCTILCTQSLPFYGCEMSGCQMACACGAIDIACMGQFTHPPTACPGVVCTPDAG